VTGDRRLEASSPNKVHQFQTVTFFEHGFGPGRARNDLAVLFYRHPVGLETQSIDQLIDAGRIAKGFKAAGVTVQNQCERHTLKVSRGFPCDGRSGAVPWTRFACRMSHSIRG